MTRHILQQASSAPGRPAVAHRGRVVSYGELDGRIEAAAQALARQGLRPPGVAALCVSDLLERWVIQQALQRLGLATAAVRFPHEVGLLGLSQGAALVVDGPRVIAADASRGPGPGAGPPAGGHLVATSGTTGTIKTVLIDAASEPAQLDDRAAGFGIDAGSVVEVFDWGLWTSIGYLVPLAVWRAGGCVVLRQSTDYRAEWPPAAACAIATPMILQALLADPAAGPWPGAPRLFVGGAALPGALAAEALARLTPNLFQIVASTEAGIWRRTAIRGPRDVLSHAPVPGRAVEVVDEAGRVLGPGEAGRVRVGVLAGTEAYFGDPAASRVSFADGWFYPGDLGVMDPDGRLVLKGRASEVIAAGGAKFAPEQFESAIQARFPSLACAVFGAPGEGAAGEELHVVFEGQRPGVEALRALAAEELAVFPKVHFHRADSLPRTPGGKLQRAALKQRVLGS